MIDERFGEWTVITEAEPRGANRYWLCRCSCGVKREVYQGALKRVDKPSRSCLSCRKAKPGHRLTKTSEYALWANMKQRCYNPKHPYYHRYGGKDVKVCEEWLYDPVAFITWARANGYFSGCHIHRRNDGDYKPSECVFLSAEEHQLYH